MGSKSKRLFGYIFFLILVWESHADILSKVGDFAGFQTWNAIEQIQFTFNAKLPDKTISRSWQWNRTTDMVTFIDDSLTYSRKNIGDQKDLDKKFINDSYWLLFPIFLQQEKGIKVQTSKTKVLSALQKDSSFHIVIQYTDNQGYTPNDIYELFVDESGKILEWIYRKGGTKTPTRKTTWEKYEQFNTLVLSTVHKGENNFMIWFTNILVQ